MNTDTNNATKMTMQRKWAVAAQLNYHRTHDSEFAIAHLAGQMKRQEMIDSLVESHLARQEENKYTREALVELQLKIKNYGTEMCQI